MFMYRINNKKPSLSRLSEANSAKLCPARQTWRLSTIINDFFLMFMKTYKMAQRQNVENEDYFYKEGGGEELSQLKFLGFMEQQQLLPVAECQSSDQLLHCEEGKQPQRVNGSQSQDQYQLQLWLQQEISLKSRLDELQRQNYLISLTIADTRRTFKEEMAQLWKKIASIQESNAKIRESNAKIRESNAKIRKDMAQIRESNAQIWKEIASIRESEAKSFAKSAKTFSNSPIFSTKKDKYGFLNHDFFRHSKQVRKYLRNRVKRRSHRHPIHKTFIVY